MVDPEHKDFLMKFKEEEFVSNELRPNGGSSMKDQLTRLEQRVDDLFTIISKR